MDEESIIDRPIYQPLSTYDVQKQHQALHGHRNYFLFLFLPFLHKKNKLLIGFIHISRNNLLLHGTVNGTCDPSRQAGKTPCSLPDRQMFVVFHRDQVFNIPIVSSTGGGYTPLKTRPVHLNYSAAAHRLPNYSTPVMVTAAGSDRR